MGHTYVLVYDMSAQIFHLFCNWVVCLMFELYKFFIYCDINSLLDICIGNTCYLSVPCFFIFLVMSCEDHTFSNLIRFSFFFLSYPKKYLPNPKSKDSLLNNF